MSLAHEEPTASDSDPLECAPLQTPASDTTLSADACDISIDWAQALARGTHQELKWLVIHARTSQAEFLWCVPAVSRTQPHTHVESFLLYTGLKMRSIRFDNAREFGKCKLFQ